MQEIFPTYNEDEAYLSLVSSLEVNPVFIMGFHRSGTTFIYDSVAKCFPLANLDLYSIFFYDRILSNVVNKNEQSDRQWFNRYLDYLGIKDRGLDRFPVKDNMVEEYCWALSQKNKFLPTTKTKAKDLPKLKELCQKLTYANPGVKGVLLKNPFDYPYAEKLLRYFPNAKFVYVKRKPSQILNSFLNGCIELMTPHPFFALMTRTQPPLSQFFVRLSARVMKDQNAERVLRNISFSSQRRLKKDLALAKKSLSALPKESYVVVDYEEFNKDPVASLRAVQQTLNIDFSSPPELIEPKPRVSKTLDVVKKYADKLDLCAW